MDRADKQGRIFLATCLSGVFCLVFHAVVSWESLFYPIQCFKHSVMKDREYRVWAGAHRCSAYVRGPGETVSRG